MSDLFRLQLFCHLVTSKSFSKTAESFYLTQPAVSLQVKKLEESYGTLLFDRSGRKLRLTESGKELHRYAKRVVNLMEQSKAALKEHAELEAGRLHIGASTGLADHHLPALLGRFLEKNPSLYVRLLVDTTEHILQKALEHGLDVAFVGLKEPSLAKGLNFEQVFEDEVILVKASGSRVKASRVSAKRLASLPLILHQEGSGLRHFLEEELPRRGVVTEGLNVVGEFGLHDSCKQAVLMDRGLTFASRPAVESELSRGLLKEVKLDGPPLIRHFYMVVNSEQVHSRAAESFIAFCRAASP